MKTTTITLILSILLISNIFSQQINKNLTVVEISTGTWCPYCPGGALGANDLLAEYGNNVAIIEHHLNSLNGGKSDPFSHWGDLRRDYYEFAGAPIAYFDGIKSGCVGSANTSVFPCYQPKYLDAIDDLTSFDVDLQVNTTDYINFTATITIDKVANYSGAEPVLQLILTESHIQYNWQNQSELNFVNRRMYPDQNGTQLDFTGGVTQQVITINFTKESAWNINNCTLVAFIQNWGSQQILNGDKSGLLPAVGFNNVEASEVTVPSDSVICNNSFVPKVRIKNMGQDNLTSCDIEYSLIGGTPQTFHWVGNMAFGQSANVTLAEISSSLETDTLTVTLLNPNGETDDNINDNVVKKGFYVPKETTTTVTMEMNTGKWGWEISWKLQKTNGDTIYYGGGEANPYSEYQIINETFNLNIDECYIFTVNDWDYGNGFDSDDGFVKLKDYYDVELFNVSGLFGQFKSFLLKPTEQVASVNNISENSFKIFPNPTTGTIVVESKKLNIESIEITDITGKTISNSPFEGGKGDVNLQINNSHSSINLTNQPKGIYFIKIQTENNIITKKIMKN